MLPIKPVRKPYVSIDLSGLEKLPQILKHTEFIAGHKVDTYHFHQETGESATVYSSDSSVPVIESYYPDIHGYFKEIEFKLIIHNPETDTLITSTPVLLAKLPALVTFESMGKMFCAAAAKSYLYAETIFDELAPGKKMVDMGSLTVDTQKRLTVYRITYVNGEIPSDDIDDKMQSWERRLSEFYARHSQQPSFDEIIELVLTLLFPKPQAEFPTLL